MTREGKSNSRKEKKMTKEELVKKIEDDPKLKAMFKKNPADYDPISRISRGTGSEEQESSSYAPSNRSISNT